MKNLIKKLDLLIKIELELRFRIFKDASIRFELIKNRNVLETECVCA